MTDTAPALTIYGIKSCDTMKKAMNWLTEHEYAYTFHDYKKAGIDEDTLRAWLAKVGHETLINRRGTTWRKLADEDKADIDNDKAVRLMMENTSLIKRPVLEDGDKVLLGFNADSYAAFFDN